MKNRKWLPHIVATGLLAVFVVLGLACASGPNPPVAIAPPHTFQAGEGGEVTILLRQGLDFDRAFREVAHVLILHDFNNDVVHSAIGYLRTEWRFTGVGYRTRVIAHFNPAQTQLIVNVQAEFLQGETWIRGHDAEAAELLRNDLTMIVGN